MLEFYWTVTAEISYSSLHRKTACAHIHDVPYVITIYCMNLPCMLLPTYNNRTIGCELFIEPRTSYLAI